MGTGRLSLTGAAAIALFGLAGIANSHTLDVCVDYGCDVTRPVRIGPEERARLAALFAATPDARAERQAVAAAVGELERFVGERAGTAADAPRNTALYGTPGQLDCIAESTNTLKYLQWLDEAGLLTHHRVAGREVRRRWLFAIHWTAVLEESFTGDRYAVDSWYGANGDPALVLPIAAWRRGESGKLASDAAR